MKSRSSVRVMTRNKCNWGMPRKLCVCERSKSLCYKSNERRLKSRTRPKLSSIAEAYDEQGFMKGVFIGTDVEDKIRNYHERAARVAFSLGDEDYKVPTGVRMVAKVPLTPGQLAHRYPWAVVVTARGRKRRKLCTNIGHAVSVHKELTLKGYTAYIISRSRGYDIPAAYRGRIPKPYVWCPRCLAPRRYERQYLDTGRPETFSALRKEPRETKGGFEFKDRILHLLRCPICGSTNRDPAYRRSNQPWETRRIKKGARRVKRRYKTKKLLKAKKQRR